MAGTTYPSSLQYQLERISSDSDDAIGPDTIRSFCANSDLFAHGLTDAPRDLSDKTYQRQADFFKKPLQF